MKTWTRGATAGTRPGRTPTQPAQSEVSRTACGTWRTRLNPQVPAKPSPPPPPGLLVCIYEAGHASINEKTVFFSSAGFGFGSGFFPIFGGGFFKTFGYSSSMLKSFTTVVF